MHPVKTGINQVSEHPLNLIRSSLCTLNQKRRTQGYYICTGNEEVYSHLVQTIFITGMGGNRKHLKKKSHKQAYYHQQRDRPQLGASCSKLMTSFVNG